MKAKIKKIVLYASALVLVVSSGLVAQAHGPENHLTPLPAYDNQTLCKVKFDSYKTAADTAFCDPSDPANLQGGINKQSHPDGLCYASFNNYTDEIEKDTGYGMDPYGTIPALFGDERNFVKAIKFKAGESWDYADMSDSVTVEEGDIVQVFMYMHNDGNPCFNDNVNVPTNKFFSNWKTTSHNTKLSFTPAFNVEGGKAFFELNNGATFNGNIWSNNAVNENGVIGGKTVDNVYIQSSESDLRLELIDGKSFYVDMLDDPGFEWWAYEHPITDPAKILSEAGIALTTLDGQAGNFKANGGDFYASEPYIALVRFRFEVKKSELPPAPVCKSLSAETQTTEINGQSAQLINITDYQFEGLTPEDLKFTYKSLDPSGRFYLLPNTTTALTEVTNVNADQQVAYIGNGPVTVAIQDYEDSCNAILQIAQDEPICEDLKINHNETIFMNQVSHFNAKSEDQNGDLYNGMITYKIDPGYGLFYLGTPSGHPINQSEKIVEFNPSDPMVTPSGGFCQANRVGDLIEITQANANENNYPQILDLISSLATGEGLPDPHKQGKYFNTNDLFGPAFSNKNAVEDFRLSNLNNLPINQSYSAGNQPETGSNLLTVAPGTDVYFVGFKEGQNRILVLSNCNNNNTCRRHFDIAPNPLDCKASTLDATIYETNTKPLCLETGQRYSLKQEFFSDAAKTTKLPANSIKVKWESTDPNGKFIDLADIPALVPHASPYIGSQYVHYDGGGQVTSSLYSLNGELVAPDNICNNKIQACEQDNKCSSLTLNSSLGNPIEISDLDNGQNSFLTVQASDLQGNALPSKTKFKWSTDTNGKLSYNSISGQQLNLLFEETPVKYSKGDGELNAGKVSLEIDSSDPLYSDSCKAEIAVIDQLVCESLNVKIIKDETGEQVTDLEAKTLYTISATANYSGTFTNPIKYTIDSGWFIAGSLPVFNPGENLLKTIEVADGQSVKLLTSNITQSDEDTLRVQAKGFFNNDCDQTFGIKVTPSEEVCLDLSIDRPSNWTVDEGEVINDRRELFEIDVRTRPSSLADNLDIHWEVSNNDGSWKDGVNNENEKTKGEYRNYLYDFTNDAKVDVWASYPGSNSEISACKDSIDVDTKDTEEKPKIDKMVYPENNVGDADDLINIADKTVDEYVTFAIQFEVDDAKSVRIYDQDLVNGSISGDQGGKLEFMGMRINVFDDKNEEKYTILEDESYKANSDSNKYLGDKNYDSDGNDNLDEFEDDYKCGSEKDSDRVCIEGKFDDAVEEFKDSGYIEIQNLQKIGQNGVIIFKYQMKNNSSINEEACQKISTSNGCGEKFDNNANYEAWKTSSPSGNADFKDDADAKTIVLCPYIIKRQGGDSYFHDEFKDYGIDIAQCSEVKGDDGIDIIATPSTPQKNISTGAGDLYENTILELPSHDICQFSNISTNLEGYNNVLKNFSSTICELRAEVAEGWTETYINKSIKANISLIAAWNKNLNTIETITDSNSLPASNGIFMKENGVDLHIDLSDEFLPVGGPNNLPAAQTYIVQGADLYIDSNILYPAATDPNNPKSYPSLALIVIDGNIYIDNDVTEIHAAIISLDTKNTGNKGQIMGDFDDKVTANLLSIHGNLIGNVQNLFKNRKGVGDPKKNEGSVTIFFDQSILLNPPQGLSQLIDISQLESVN